jgi:hypothetical protein
MSKDKYYNTPKARLDTVLGAHKKFFELLRTLREEYIDGDAGCLISDSVITGISFQDWLVETYGIQLVLDSDGRITANHNIVDDKKYLICRLKYPG